MRENRLKILLLYRKLIPSILLCGHEQFSYLNNKGEIEYKAINISSIKTRDLNWADAVVLGRLDSTYERRISKIIHDAHKYMIYIIDDDLLNLPKEVSSSAYYNQAEIHSNIEKMIEMSDAIVSPSLVLLEKYGQGKVMINVEEPVVYPSSFKPHDYSSPIKIGFAGSVDRVHDIETILYESLKKIKEEYKENVQIEFFGAIPSFSEELDAKCITYNGSYKEYIEKLTSLNWDIGLAPMPKSEFHACKHYIKMIEYSGCGIYPIYSNEDPYKRFNENYHIGTMVNNDADDWFDAIKELIDDREKLNEQRKLVNEVICKEMSLEKCSYRLLDDLNRIKLSSESYFVKNDLLWLKIEGLFRRGMSIFRSRFHGLKEICNPKRMIKKINPKLIIKKSTYFDKDWYLRTYHLDTKDPAYHYLYEGYKLGYDPSNKFNGLLYIEANPDVGDMNPLLHYEVYGKYEHRKLYTFPPFHQNKVFPKLNKENVDLNSFFSFLKSNGAKTYCVPKEIFADKYVLVLSNLMNLSGAPIALYNVVVNLKNRGYHPVIVSCKDGPLTKKMTSNDIPVIIYENIYKDNILDSFYHLFDFIFVNTLSFGNIINSLNGTDNKVIWWLHESKIAYTVTDSSIKDLPIDLSDNINIYAVGDYAKKRMHEFRPKYKVNELYYFLPNKINVSDENYKFGFEDSDKIVFGMVGTLEVRKGYEVLLNALDIVDNKNKIKFVLVGKNDNQDIYDSIKNYSGEVEIEYIEKIDNDLMPLFYKNINCLICALLDDPMPIVVTEAWEYGVPVICSISTGSASLIEKYGGGIIYKDNSSLELAKTIDRFILNEYDNKKIIDDGHNIYTKLFTEKAFNQKFDKLLEKIS